MNWQELFKTIEKKVSLKELLEIINLNKNFELNNAGENFVQIEYKTDKEIEGLLYYDEGKHLYKINYDSSIITINKERLIHFIKSEILFNELSKENVSRNSFFDYSFMIDMHMSADAPSGQTHLKNSLLRLEKALSITPIYLNTTTPIKTIEELNYFLKKSLYGFKGKIEDYK